MLIFENKDARVILLGTNQQDRHFFQTFLTNTYKFEASFYYINKQGPKRARCIYNVC